MPLIALMTQGYLTEAQMNTLLRYMLQAGTTEHPGALIRTLAAQSPRHKELMMTIAEWLEEKGRKQGQQEGEQEGRSRHSQHRRQNAGARPRTSNRAGAHRAER